MAVEYKNSLGRYRRYLSNLQNQPLWNASFWVGLTILLVILMVFFFLRPTLVTISGLLGRAREQKELLQRMDEKLEILGQAQQNYSQTKEGQVRLDKVLPEEPQWKELADILFQIATDSGAIVKRVEVNEVSVAGKKIIENQNINSPTEKDKLPAGVETMDILLNVEGEYGQIKEILTKIEQSGRIILIKSARINKGKDGILSLNISGYAVFFRYQEEKP